MTQSANGYETLKTVSLESALSAISYSSIAQNGMFSAALIEQNIVGLSHAEAIDLATNLDQEYGPVCHLACCAPDFIRDA